MDRRHFLGAAAGTAAGLIAPVGTAIAQPVSVEPPAPPLVTLGATGIRTSRLAQGTGVRGGDRQSEQTRLGFQALVDLFQHAYRRGVRCFDLADLYGTHVYFREALRTIPREEVTILTKLWWRYDGPEADTGNAARGQMVQTALERFRHELTTDRLDIVLLHCMTDPKWPRRMAPYMDALSAAKDRQQVRAVGVSCHDLGALRAAAVEPWVEVILARINPGGVKMDGTTDEVIAVLREAKAQGKAIIGMKILGEGQLADQREHCIKYAQGHDFLDAMTIGFDRPRQIDEVLHLLARYPAAARTAR